MTKEGLFNSIIFNVFVLFINTSISDAFFNSFFIPASVISIVRLELNIIFIFMVFYYFLTKRIRIKYYKWVFVFFGLIGLSVFWGTEKFEAIKIYINFAGCCCYLLLLCLIANKDRIIVILKNYAIVIVLCEIIALTILGSVGYMIDSPTSKVVRGIHLSRSTMIIYLNLCIFIFIYYMHVFKNNRNSINIISIIMILISMLLIIYSRSSTGLLTVALILPLFLIANMKKLINIILGLVVSGGILLPFMSLDSSFLNSIVTAIFHKTLTFSGRKYIWDYALDKLNGNFLFGNGLNSTTYLLEGKVIPIYERYASHTHNGFLEVYLQSGIIGLIIITTILIIAFKNTNNFDPFESKLLKVYLIVFIVFNFMEPYLIEYVSICTLWLPIIYVMAISNRRVKGEF